MPLRTEICFIYSLPFQKKKGNKKPLLLTNKSHAEVSILAVLLGEGSLGAAWNPANTIFHHEFSCAQRWSGYLSTWASPFRRGYFMQSRLFTAAPHPAQDIKRQLPGRHLILV